MRRTKKEIMEGIDCIKSRIVANNTVEYHTKDGCKIFRLHLTDIVTYKQDGSFVLNSDGWKTPTTKNRMNEYIPSGYHLYQDKSVWYLTTGGYWHGEEAEKWIYQDGMQVFPDGKIKGAAKDNKHVKKWLKLINQYCKALKDLETLPLPDGGDCWFCLMLDRDNTTGKKSGDKEHLKAHLKEKYVHGSLIFNALKWSGYPHPAFIFQADIRNSIVNSVKRYFKANLGIAS